MVGVGFPERNDSFDFVAALEDFRRQLKAAKGGPTTKETSSGKDYSLKEGEKISINIPGMQAKKAEPKTSNLIGGGGLKKLAPPPKKSGFPSNNGAGMSSGISSNSDALGGLDFGIST
jgi:hypothetical protein